MPSPFGETCSTTSKAGLAFTCIVTVATFETKPAISEMVYSNESLPENPSFGV